MDRPADSPPDDVEALRALALNVIAERDAAMAERDRLLAMNEKLRQLLRKAQGFEAKSERPAKLDTDYTYAPGRHGEHLEKLLATYRGIVRCDGYAPYKKLPAGLHPVWMTPA